MISEKAQFGFPQSCGKDIAYPSITGPREPRLELELVLGLRRENPEMERVKTRGHAKNCHCFYHQKQMFTKTLGHFYLDTPGL